MSHFSITHGNYFFSFHPLPVSVCRFIFSPQSNVKGEKNDTINPRERKVSRVAHLHSLHLGPPSSLPGTRTPQDITVPHSIHLLSREKRTLLKSNDPQKTDPYTE